MISIIKEGKLFDYSKNTISMVIDLLIDCIENKDNSLISTFEDAKKTYMMCEKIIHEK